MRQAIFPLIKDSCGVTAIEYALIAALIAIAAIAGFTLVGTTLVARSATWPAQL
jgi:Flp pilus assembly pilin Flp